MLSRLGLSRYLAKIERRKPLSPGARDAFLATSAQLENVPANSDFGFGRRRSERTSLVVEGLVSRHRTLRSGNRQILAFHVPGDMADLQSAIVAIPDQGFRTHSATTLATIDHADILALAANHPELGRAFWFDTIVDALTYREWTINIERRSALARTAHLILELATKMSRAGLVVDGTFDFPITQPYLADAVGISSVHLNRMLQSLRGDKLIRTHMRRMHIENEPALRELAGFDPAYLHISATADRPDRE